MLIVLKKNIVMYILEVLFIKRYKKIKKEASLNEKQICVGGLALV